MHSVVVVLAVRVAIACFLKEMHAECRVSVFSFFLDWEKVFHIFRENKDWIFLWNGLCYKISCQGNAF